MRYFYILILICCAGSHLEAQFSRDSIQSDFVFYQRRVDFDKYMREKTIEGSFAKPLDSTTEDQYREACWAISQFMIQSPGVENGFRKLFAGYPALDPSTKRAFLEAVYSTYSNLFQQEVQQMLAIESVPKLFAMQAIYLQRAAPGEKTTKGLQKTMRQSFPNWKQFTILNELEQYLSHHDQQIEATIPPLSSLFNYRKTSQQKTIYSFQRWNRDYPGLAVVQHADGSFERDASGQLRVFEQLARSASNLPYFITNGSTPQGIFRILGTDVSNNKFIGPTPNFQLVMPNEVDSLYWNVGFDSTRDVLQNYQQLLPVDWRTYPPIAEAFYAGKAGRTEIIAHGTTIDPDYFKDKPFFPLTPTMGCLAAKETWNIFNGKFLISDQFNLVNAFLATPGNTGHLFVINLDNKQEAVTPAEIERLVQEFEKK